MLATLLTLVTTPTMLGEIPFYIGTYTSANGSKGIYRASLNPHDGSLSQPRLVAEGSNPSFLASSPDGRFLYAAHELGDGKVSAYEITGDSLRWLNTQPAETSAPCHLAVDPSGRALLVAGYTGGSVTLLPIRADGSLGVVASKVQNEGSGPVKSRQERPHMHAVVPDSRGRFVYACDLGTDEVLVMRLDAGKGVLRLSNPRSARAPAGGGPRHGALHPSGRWLYVNNEMGNSVSVFAVDRSSGGLRLQQTLPTLPASVPRRGKSTAEIAVHPSGRFVYVSNRGHDSIAAFAVQENGSLGEVGRFSAGVRTPRGFDLDPSGRWLVVAGQDSGDLRVLAVDSRTGRLRRLPHAVKLDRPVCVLFPRALASAAADGP